MESEDRVVFVVFSVKQGVEPLFFYFRLDLSYRLDNFFVKTVVVFFHCHFDHGRGVVRVGNQFFVFFNFVLYLFLLDKNFLTVFHVVPETGHRRYLFDFGNAVAERRDTESPAELFDIFFKICDFYLVFV